MATEHVDRRPYCQQHQRYYSALAPCAGCALDPAPPVTVEQESPADPRLLAIEHRAREVWEALIERGLERLRQRSADKDKDSIGESTMTKVFAEAAKFMNVEIERVEARARRQYMRDLMAHEQIMAGLRKAH